LNEQHRQELEFRQVVELGAQQRLAEEERQHQWEIEERQSRIVDEYRRQDRTREDERELDAFLDKYNLSSVPVPILKQRVMSMLGHFGIPHKSLLIKILYEAKLLGNYDNGSSERTLSLSDADLSGIQMGNKDNRKLKKNRVCKFLGFLLIRSFQLFLIERSEYYLVIYKICHQ
jgi:hypothetical protein